MGSILIVLIKVSLSVCSDVSESIILFLVFLIIFFNDKSFSVTLILSFFDSFFGLCIVSFFALIIFALPYLALILLNISSAFLSTNFRNCNAGFII